MQEGVTGMEASAVLDISSPSLQPPAPQRHSEVNPDPCLGDSPQVSLAVTGYALGVCRGARMWEPLSSCFPFPGQRPAEAGSACPELLHASCPCSGSPGPLSPRVDGRLGIYLDAPSSFFGY